MKMDSTEDGVHTTDGTEDGDHVVDNARSSPFVRNGIGGPHKDLAWEYELCRGRWIRYDSDICEKLNKSSANVLELEVDESRLQIDFSTMKQKNLDTGFVRSLRCAIRNNAGDYRVWEYIDSKRRWRSFDPSSATKLENAFNVGSGNVNISLSGTDFITDFESSVIKSEDGLSEYKIRSHVSKGEPSVSARPVPRAERTRAAKRIAAESVAEQSAALKVNGAPPASKRKTRQKGDDEKMDVDSSDDEKRKKKVLKSRRKKTKSGSDKADDVKGSADDDDKNRMKKIVLKGAAAVDSECHELLRSTHVYTEFDDVYDALLNQTNTQNNNNKYFIIQLLESDDEKRYWVWFRWGRVGYKGQTSLNPCGSDLAKGKKLFCEKFKDKTKNDWTGRASFVKVAGKYDYLPADYSKVIEEQKKDENDTEKKLVESKLESTLQHLLRLICDVRAMEETMMELEYDATKAPLGKVTEEQIKAGYSALKEIENYIKKKDFSSSFVEAVNNYYTKIPHFFGMRQPPLIKTTDQLRAEIKLLEALSEIGMAVRSFKKESNDGETDVHPIDRHYMNMNCDISILRAEHPEFKLVADYLRWTHAPTHNMYHMRIHNLFAVCRSGEKERFMSHLGNRKLLWHGSRLTNWYGILSQGLRIAPPEAPATGYMFGKGIYFADMATKSANYCYPQPAKPGLLVLAEVALGEMRELLDADYNADKLPAGKHSTKGLGSIGPNPSTYVTLEDGCEVPCGKPVAMPANKKHYTLNYNEYIVYDVKQVWIRYLVEVDFIFD